MSSVRFEPGPLGLEASKLMFRLKDVERAPSSSTDNAFAAKNHDASFKLLLLATLPVSLWKLTDVQYFVRMRERSSMGT